MFHCNSLSLSINIDNGEIRTMGELQSVEARSGRGTHGQNNTHKGGPSPGGRYVTVYAMLYYAMLSYVLLCCVQL